MPDPTRLHTRSYSAAHTYLEVSYLNSLGLIFIAGKMGIMSPTRLGGLSKIK